MDARQTAVRKTLLDKANSPFKYGVVDCCLFAADVAKNITGKDYGASFEHDNEAEAYRYIDEAGSLGNLITRTLGVDPVSADQLETGDPVLLHMPITGDTLGVFMGDHAIVKSERGTIRINPTRIKQGWRLCQAQ